MQSTGHTPTHDLSLTPMHGSVITYAIASVSFRGTIKINAAAPDFGPDDGRVHSTPKERGRVMAASNRRTLGRPVRAARKVEITIRRRRLPPLRARSAH